MNEPENHIRLRSSFLQLAAAYTPYKAIAMQQWLDIEKAYSSKGRHYHTLTHINDLVRQLTPFEQSSGWHTILFATFYHDIIYNTLRHDNEEQSAELAANAMAALNVPYPIIKQCTIHILATQHHQPSNNEDTNLFTDADMSILGSAPDTYNIYTQQVRKEYAIYPDLIYKPGRKKVLLQFLDMEHIFKTQYFYDAYEQQARSNILMELNNL